MKAKQLVLNAAVATALFSGQQAYSAETFTEALEETKAYGNINLRWESVDQDNALEDANALTLRTRLGFKTGTVDGFSGVVEFEDSRSVLGREEFNAAGLNGNPEFSVIADPETTEVDQAFIQYKDSVVTAKLGRQVYTLDGHRFVGHVGWRQDRQTFDAATLKLTPSKELTINAAYFYGRNRIFAEARDVESEDALLNVAYKFPAGTLKTYGYFLEETDAANPENDTVGASFDGKAGDFKYRAEFASQERDANGGADEISTTYLNLEVGGAAGGVNLKAGYELLGSDDGAGGFVTPLATLHKFNGWADQFLATPAGGLQDIYFSVGGKVLGGKWLAVYHEFSEDEGETLDANELNLQFVRGFGKHYSVGVKGAFFSADETPDNFVRVDTDKVWAWVTVKF